MGKGLWRLCRLRIVFAGTLCAALGLMPPASEGLYQFGSFGCVSSSLCARASTCAAPAAGLAVRVLPDGSLHVLLLPTQRRLCSPAPSARLQVCDTHGTITFATWDMAALLGMSPRKLVGTKLEALLPPPYNSMHTKWLQETPTTIPSNSCRAGVVVNLVNSSHVLVPVRIKVHQMEDQGRTLHVVRVSSVRAHVQAAHAL